MDGEFDSQNFLVADSGMRIYAAIRGGKLYTATWSPKGGGNDHYLFITDTFGDPLPTSAAGTQTAPRTTATGPTTPMPAPVSVLGASKRAAQAPAFSSVIQAADIQGMDAKSFGLYAKGGSGSSVKAFRPLTTALDVGDSVTFRWGVNWDSGNGDGGTKDSTSGPGKHSW